MAPPFPIVTAAAIAAAKTERRHFLNNAAMRLTTCISDMAGMGRTLGVHHVTVPAHTETTEMHHHAADAEWIYVLQGTLVSRMVPIVFNSGTPTAGLVPLPSGVDAQVEENAVGPGDFIGFPGGPGEQYAHTMVAGPQGAEYLVGGTRKEIDVCTYPLKGRTLVVRNDGARAVVDSTDLVDPAEMK